MESTKKLAEIGIIAALYAILTWLIAPIAYGAFQFRVSEVLKSIVVYRKHLIWAFVVGNFLSNIMSPYAGVWEFLFMPLANLAGGYLCWKIGQYSAWAGALLFAFIISISVSVMLSFVLNIFFWALFPFLFISESVLIVGGVPIIAIIIKRLGYIEFSKR